MVCVGSATIDVLVKSKGFKVMKSHQVQGGVAMAEVYGGKTEADEMEVSTGGSATNVAVALSRFGFATACLSRVGEDWISEKIFDDLHRFGIETSLIQVDKKGSTALSVVLVASDGGRSIITHRGASAEISADEVDWGKVSSAEWIHLGAVGGKMNLVEDVIGFAREKGIGISWNPGKGELENRERMIRLLPKVDLLVLNRMEAAILVRHEYDEIKVLAKNLLAYGCMRVAVTDGKRGAGVAQGNSFIKANAFKTVVVDETGAGDAFVAGMIAGILSDKNLEVCLEMGLANGANQVGSLGSKTGLLDMAEMKKWLRRKIRLVEEKIEAGGDGKAV